MVCARRLIGEAETLKVLAKKMIPEDEKAQIAILEYAKVGEIIVDTIIFSQASHVRVPGTLMEEFQKMQTYLGFYWQNKSCY